MFEVELLVPAAEGAESEVRLRLRLSDDGASAHAHGSSARLLLWVLSRAGKPIFTALGQTPDQYSLLAGVLTALSCVVEVGDDQIRSIHAPGVIIVVRTVGELLLATADVGAHLRPIALLERYLLFVHSQLQSLLTSSLDRRLAARPGADVAPLLEGAERFLRGAALLPDGERAMALALGPCARSACFPIPAREALVKAIVRAPRPSALLFAAVLLNGSLVALVQPSATALGASDLILLANVLNASAAFRLGGPDAAWWAPVCLPGIDARAWLHAYTALLAPPGLALVLLTSSPADFYPLAQLCAAVRTTLASSLLHPSTLLPTGEYNTSLLNVPYLLHFVCRHKIWQQYTSPAVPPPFTLPQHAVRLHALYHRTAFLRNRATVVCERSDSLVLLSWSAGQHDLWAVFSPVVSVREVQKGCQRLVEWCKEQDKFLFAEAETWS